MKTTLALLLTLALAPAAQAGNFALAGPGGSIPDPTGTPGAWNGTFTGVALQSSVAVPQAVASVSSVTLHGLTHTWRGDLHVYLRDPAGAKHNLIVRPGFSGSGAGDHGDFVFGDFVLVPSNGATLQAGPANLSPGYYEPYMNTGAGRWTNGISDTPLGQIAGPAGSWTLVIEDWANLDAGSLTGWTLAGEDLQPSQLLCSGDGLDPTLTTACPCGNFGLTGRGCGNSVDPQGGKLEAVGTLNPDTMVLYAEGMPATAPCLYLQSDATGDTLWGDGVRCLGNSLVRLRTRTSAGGASQFPDAGDPLLSVRGGVAPGSGAVRFYQGYYRNASSTFCPPATANATNGWRLVW